MGQGGYRDHQRFEGTGRGVGSWKLYICMVTPNCEKSESVFVDKRKSDPIGCETIDESGYLKI